MCLPLPLATSTLALFVVSPLVGASMHPTYALPTSEVYVFPIGFNPYDPLKIMLGISIDFAPIIAKHSSIDFLMGLLDQWILGSSPKILFFFLMDQFFLMFPNIVVFFLS